MSPRRATSTSAPDPPLGAALWEIQGTMHFDGWNAIYIKNFDLFKPFSYIFLDYSINPVKSYEKKRESHTPVVLPLSMRFLEKAAEIPKAWSPEE